MNWYAIYRQATKELVSLGTVVADPLPNGLVSKFIGTVRPEGEWNTTTLSFDAVVPQRIKTKLDFIELFTDAELNAILAAGRTDTRVELFVRKLGLADKVDMNSPRTIAAVNGLEQLGLIGSGRAVEVLNG